MIPIPTINSFIRVLHALPGVGSIDVFINEELLGENLAYSNVSRYLPIGPGNNRVQVFSAGDRSSPIVDTEVDLPPSEAITLALIGEATDAGVLQILQPFGEIDPQEARVRFANLSPDAPELDLFLNDNRVIAGVAYRQVTDYSTVSPDTYGVELRSSDNSDFILARKNVEFRGGNGYIVYAIGLVEGDPAVEIIYFEDELPVVEKKEVPPADVVQQVYTGTKPKIVFKYVR